MKAITVPTSIPPRTIIRRRRGYHCQWRDAGDELAIHLLTRGQAHALDGALMQHRGAVEEFVGDELLASVRFNDAHPGHLLGQLAGEFAHHVLHVAADRADARVKIGGSSAK